MNSTEAHSRLYSTGSRARTVAGPQGVLPYLVLNTGIATLPQTETKRRERQQKIEQVQQAIADMLSGRIADCGKEFECIDRLGRLYTQTTRCNLIWCCPACCERASGQRKRELRGAANRWKAAGGETLMTTFCLYHDPCTPLTTVLNSLQQSYRAFTEGKGYTTLKHRFRHYGQRAGLGSHFQRAKRLAPALSRFAFLRAWSRSRSAGGRVRPVEAVACKCQENGRICQRIWPGGYSRRSGLSH